MYFIKLTSGEIVYYLHLLLMVVKGTTSFDDLRRVLGYHDPFPTFHAACLAHGLLQDDGEWRLCLQEASEMQTGTCLHYLFTTLLLFGEPLQPDLLWNEFKEHICDDLAYRLCTMGFQNPSDDNVYDYSLHLLDYILCDSGCSLAEWPSMPLPQQNWNLFTINPLIAKQLNYNRDTEWADLKVCLPHLNADQWRAYDQIITSVENNKGRLFFLNGPGGTGKTFIYNTICAKLQSEGTIILCVSSSGISALLIRGGWTAHSMFKILIDGLDECSSCSIQKNSQQADLIHATKAIIWDEVGAQHCHAVEAVDHTLCDICSNPQPFGGITIVLGGDFLQTLPVILRGSHEDIVDATIQCSALWEHAEVLHLHQNMRLEQGDVDAQEFVQWLLEVGHGQNMNTNSQIQFPDGMQVDNSDSLIASIYPGIDSIPPPPPNYFLNRMILAPCNADVGNMNQKILACMSGEVCQYISADEII